MARYTVELNDIVKSGLKVFNFDYTFYDETKKPEFEQRFIDHFLFREIGVETVGKFQHYLKCKCNETLPYYNLLFKTALYEYDVKNNYNLTETYTRSTTNSKTASENANQSGTTNTTGTATGSLNRSTDSAATGKKTNTLESTSDHTENTDVARDETIKETGKLNKNSTSEIDGRKVGSDTPNGLLSMSDIKANVYASKADIEDTTNKTTDAQTSSADKTNKTTDKTEGTANDTVNATSTDNTTDTVNEDVSETNSATTHNNGTITNTSNSSQNENQNGTETYTLERIGDIGVDTTPDKLKKHIELQKILTTIYTQFFDECEDLFMQIF